MIGARCLVCKLLLLLLARACWSADAGYLAWYRSPVDDTEQAYGVYLPASPAPPGGFPAAFHAHGYGWSVSGQFSDWQRRWADENGWVLININARGPTFYEGIGQEAVYEVVADACRRFGLNRARLFFTGGSMGGTGALRVGVRDPEIFAAIASVDGWADWRLWHHHWYAREDQRDDIEEFRRPLLSSAAPLYWAERAMWGRVKAIVDGKDTVVWPDNSLRLAGRLSELADGDPALYRADTVLNYDRGHGGGYDLRAIYAFFQGAAPAQLGRRVRLACWRLAYARQGWLALTQIRRFGEQAQAESLAADGRISVWTKNVARVEVLPAESPDLGPCDTCQVYVDGWLVYEGPPRRVSAEALYNAADQVAGWRLAGPRDLADDPPAAAGPEKRPGLEGPIGDVIVQPFLVAYATEGPPEEVRRHREEAEAFARGWTGFFVHGPGIVALPEDRVASRDLVAQSDPLRLPGLQPPAARGPSRLPAARGGAPRGRHRPRPLGPRAPLSRASLRGLLRLPQPTGPLPPLLARLLGALVHQARQAGPGRPRIRHGEAALGLPGLLRLQQRPGTASLRAERQR